MTIGEFAEAASQYCMMLGGSQTSCGRSTAHNKAVGGVTNSAHRYFRACDVVYDVPIAAAEADITAQRLGLKLVREGDHDHLQPIGWAAG